MQVRGHATALDGHQIATDAVDDRLKRSQLLELTQSVLHDQSAGNLQHHCATDRCESDKHKALRKFAAPGRIGPDRSEQQQNDKQRRLDERLVHVNEQGVRRVRQQTHGKKVA